jgi:hypothetical protein
MQDPLVSRIKYLAEEWERQAEELDDDESINHDSDTLLHCSEMLKEALEHSERLR